MKRSLFITSLLVCVSILFVAAGPAISDIASAHTSTNLPAPGVSVAIPKNTPSLYVRIVIDSLYCEKESKWDHATSQDEPYAMVIGIATHRNPSSWTTGKPEVFKDVDTGNNRRFTKQQRVIYEGEVPKDALVGFEAVLWEKDASSDSSVMKLADNVSNSICDWISSNDHDLKKEMPKLMVALWPFLVSSGIYLAGGGADDRIGDKDILFSYDDLLNAAQNHRHVAHRLVFDGGDEGKYWLRYHIEFGQDATREFKANFTQWDDMAVGCLDRTTEDKIVIVSDDDGPGDTGRFYIYNVSGMLIRSFDAPYKPGDRIALGDTDGNNMAEILVASRENGGQVYVYDHMGNRRNCVAVPFKKYDGFASGDVNGDGRAEIVVVRPSDRKVAIYSPLNGNKIDEFGLNWKFKGTRYTAKDTKHDILLVGDVMGDNKAEIVLIENKDGTDSVIRVYNGSGAECRSSAIAGAFGTTFTNYDAAALGDIYGDGKNELILATSEDEKSYSYNTVIVDLVTGKSVGRRSWPWYRKYSGFAAGSLIPSAKMQIVVANEEDKIVYIGR